MEEGDKTDKKESDEKIEEEIPNEKDYISNEQIEKHNKVLKSFLIWVGIFAVVGLSVYLLLNSLAHFEYRGTKFDIVNEIAPYRTAIPVSYKDGITGNTVSADYNFYFRNDPRDLEEIVPVNGDLVFKENLVLDLVDKNVTCDSLGDWNLGLGTLGKLDFFDMNLLVGNEDEEYEPINDYMFILINNKANITQIRRVGENSYEVDIKNCDDFLLAAERILIEAIIKHNELN